jgi:hypothetical protein
MARLGERLGTDIHAAASRWLCVLLVLSAACGEARNLSAYDSSVDLTASRLPPDGGGDCAGACSELPANACRTQDDCGGQSQASVLFCKHSACRDPVGFCAMRTYSCPVFATPICGCDGKTYNSSCDSDVAAVDVDYEGPCRSGPLVACDADQPCGNNQVCVDDPRTPCPVGSSCPGVCLTHSSYGCGENASAGSCLTGFCTGTQASSCDGGDCSACVFGSAPCGADTSCGTDQLCVPTLGCRDADAGACTSFCVLP